jgi:hypothetical protein
MDCIRSHFIYINIHSYIDKIVSEDIHLDHPPTPASSHSAILSSQKLIQLIQSKKIETPTSKFKFNSIALFACDLDTEHLQQYSQNPAFLDVSKPFFKNIPYIQDILIPPSLLAFHPINNLYFFFQETEKEGAHSTPKPILKIADDNSQTAAPHSSQHQPTTTKFKKTKKVAFKLTTPDNAKKDGFAPPAKYTKKNHHSTAT